ncbi:MAG: glucose 1-dehydrogenase [Noviherbaspirillum sp.]
MFDLNGKVAVVTGGNGGIGLGMARGLASAGARVVLAGRNQEKSEAAVAQLRESRYDALAIAVDVTDPASVASLFEQTARKCGRVDILINNAGTTVRKAPQDLSLDEWHLVMETNVTSAFLCARSAYPHFKQAGGGKIINIGSIFSNFGAAFAGAYGASKGAVVQLTKSLASAWAIDNIQCNAVLPGWIDTDLTRQARKEVDGLNERVLARSPSGRWGRTEDFAGVAVFLSSPASDFVNGTALLVDGGYSIQV